MKIELTHPTNSIEYFVLLNVKSQLTANLQQNIRKQIQFYKTRLQVKGIMLTMNQI